MKRKQEGGSHMAFIYKPQTPLTIKPNKTKDFIKELSNHRISKSYWDECASSRKPISKKNMEILKKMARGE